MKYLRWMVLPAMLGLCGCLAQAGSQPKEMRGATAAGVGKVRPGSASGVTAAESALPTEERILAELKEIRKLLEELSASPQKIGKTAAGPAKHGGAAGREAVALITLPSNPTKKDVEAYIDALEEATRGQSGFSTRDPQVKKLAAVGSGYVPLLFEKIGRPGSTLAFYLPNALKRIAGDEHKELILKNLPEMPRLIEVVVEKGWVEEARPLLMEGLRKKPKRLPTQWIRVVAQFEDPEATELLKEYLVMGANKESTYHSIKDIPGIDLRETVDRMWKRAVYMDESEKRQAATVAVNFGKKKALEPIFNDLHDDSPFVVRRARGLIALHTDACVSDDGTRIVFPDYDEIERWCEKNRDSLVFDEESGRFRARPPGGEGKAKPLALLSVEAGKLARGDAVPDFTAKTLDGKTITLSGLKGKVVLLDFWATWCGPCRAEIPGLKEAYAKYHDRGFEIVGINRDYNLDRLKAYMKKNGLSWPQVTDGEWGNGGLAAAYNVRGIPRPILLDRNLKVYEPSARGKRLDSALKDLFPEGESAK